MINEEFKNVEQQINYRNSWDENHYSKENKNQGDINIGTAIHVLFFFNLLKGVDFISFPREFHPFGP